MKHPAFALSFARYRTALAVAVLALSSLAAQPAVAADKLTLRVNDARGGPGDLVAVVVRTYASRPIGQGQICIGARRAGRARSTANSITGEAASTGSPFASLEKVEVFSARQDATFQVSFDGEEADVVFRSPSGSINAVDGPLAVFHFRLSNSVQEGEVYELALDTADTFIVAGSGQRLEIEPKPGELEIREEDGNGGGEEEDSIELGVTGGKVRRGKTARVRLATRDAVALSSGRIALRYDPGIIAGKPWVRIDPRYGKATVIVNTDTPGLVLIDFQSPDKSFNRAPGELFEVRMAISRQTPRGRSPVTVDAGLSFLRDADGDSLDLEIRNGSLVIR
jgi:hypothetical protein